MSDWEDPNGFQLEALLEALLFAYPDPDSFITFLDLKLDLNYATLAGINADYRNGMFQVLRKGRSGGWLTRLVAAVRADKPKSPKVRVLDRTAGSTGAPMPDGRELQDIVRNDGGFIDLLPWVERLDRLSGQVCRIECPVNQARGTGWLVAKDLVLTNWHVVRPVLKGTSSAADVACRFDYGVDKPGQTTNQGVVYRLAAEWCVDSSEASPFELGTGNAGPTSAQLDFALLRLESNAGEAPGRDGKPRRWMELKPPPIAYPAAGGIVFVIQHPQGDPVKLAVGTAGEPNGPWRILHDANTDKGSSGSPCLDVKLLPVALHNAGDPLYDGVIGQPTKNQAVPLAPILERLQAQGKAFWS